MTKKLKLPPTEPPPGGLFTGFLGKLGEVLAYVIQLPIKTAFDGLNALVVDNLDADTRIPEQVKRQLRETPAFRDFPAILPFVNIGGTIAGILPLFGAMGTSFYNDAIRTLYSIYRPSELSAAEAAAAVVGGQITPEKGFAYAARAGVPDADFRVMLDTAGTTLAPGQLLDLLNRREIDQTDVERFLRESSLKDKFIPLLLKLRFNLLGASDYIRFAVRDVFEPDKRSKFTLDQDYPEILTDKLNRIGYSETDARDSWAAHWELPSPTQVYEMLHRGKLPSGISVEDYLKSADYAPVWRQSLVDISYNPITRTDAKRMYKLRGDFDALVQNFRNNGYNEQDAKDLAEFTREDVSLETRQERELLVGPVKTAALAMYKARRISEDQLRQVLANLKYPKETVDRFVADVEFVREADHREDIAAALKSAYVKALRTRDDTIILLRQSGWDGEALDQLLETWDLLRAVTELQPHQEATRDLTKAEIVSAYAERVIAPESASSQLLALGYDQSETDILLTMADLKARKAELDQEVENIHLNYLRSAVDPGTASVQLDQLGVNVTRKTNLLLKWERERAKVIPDFTVAQLEGMVKSKSMPEDIAQRYLADQGYTSEQQTFLLSWWLGKRVSAEIQAAARER
jgi:SOS response regulatory protein OraA/RecX